MTRRTPERIIDADLLCPRCGSTFPVRDGLPNLIPQSRVSSKEWDLWRDHLDGFQARRKERVDRPHAIINRMGRAVELQASFAAFVDIKKGVLLDVGCGPGNFRRQFDPSNVRYIGLDPIPLPEIDSFEYVRGLGEFLPLKSGSCDRVTMLAALDHLRDVDAFLSEVVRVLKPSGRFHLLQSVHEVRGLSGSIKWLAHEVKDRLENRATEKLKPGTPKHMSEYNERSLRLSLEKRFAIERKTRYSPGVLNPESLFLTLIPKHALALVG